MTAPGDKKERDLRTFKSCLPCSPRAPRQPHRASLVAQVCPGPLRTCRRLLSRPGQASPRDEMPLLASSEHFVLTETAAVQVCGMSCQMHARPPRVAYVRLADEGGRRPSNLGPGAGQHLPQLHFLESSP